MLQLDERRALPAVLAVAVLLRLAILAANVASRPRLFRSSPARQGAVAAAFSNPARPFMPAVGFEVGNVAYALACTGEGYASPFGGGTGPTAWVAPGLVTVYALAFSLFGCMSGASVLALFAVALAGSTATAWLAYEAAARLDPHDRRAPVLAALLVALSPWDLRLYHAGSLLDLHLPSLGLMLLLVLLLRLRERPSTGRLVGFSVAAALIVLVNPVLAAVAVCGLGFLALRGRVPPVRAAAAFLAALLVLVGPYVAWQRARLGGWVFVKSNLPFELQLGNRPGADGLHTPGEFAAFHPSQSEAAFREYRRQGELQYVRDRGRQFWRELAPGRFVRTTLRRAAHFFFLYTEMPWDGGWRFAAKRAFALLPGLVLLLYPFVRRRLGGGLREADVLVYLLVGVYAAPYLVTAVSERYVVPVTAPALVLAAGAVAALWRRSGGQPGAVSSTPPPGGQEERRTHTTSGGRGRHAGDSVAGP